MGIQVQTIIDRCVADLDAEGSDYYKFDNDFKPAINQAVEWLVTVFNQIFADKKVTPEQLRDLIKTKVWQANKFSRVSYNPADTGHDLWSIIAVMPLPTLHPNNAITPLVNKIQSKFMPNKSFVGSLYSCDRLTSEEWNINQLNPFIPGNTVLTGSLKEFAYRDWSDYSSSTYVNTVAPEIEIRPSVSEQYVAIEYIKYPSPITLITDVLEFPTSMTQIIVEKTLSVIANKQGDQTTLWQINEGDIKRITGMFS